MVKMNRVLGESCRSWDFNNVVSRVKHDPSASC